MRHRVFHPDFKPLPYWWEAWRPADEQPAEVPGKTRVAIVGGGYGGLATALELARQGVECVVIEANAPGEGASTRNGGGVSGGVNIGKSITGAWLDPDSPRAAALLADGADAFSTIERLIADERIECCWKRNGRFVGAWTPRAWARQAARVEQLNTAANSGAWMLPRERQREEIASDFYFGGMVVERSASLHPALYFKGLLDAVRRRGVPVCAHARVVRIARRDRGWTLHTARGELAATEVVIATNGETGDLTPALKRRLIPAASHIIATEVLPADLAHSLVPKDRTLADTRRVLSYFRLSPDRRRMIYGGRARFTSVSPEVSAPILHRFMTERFPQLAGVRVTHAWSGNVAFTLDALPHAGRLDGLHYLLGCNGSGVAMMTYLGVQTARRIAGLVERLNAFESGEFPDHPLYTGNPWFLPLAGTWYRTRDRLERMLAGG
jgi:glycine/D-amino acid oxidase-like deaminating enzyme